MRVKFHREYDHTFPSRAVLNFPAGHEGTVKAEVGEAAIAAGAATEVKPRAAAESTPSPTPAKRGRKPRAKPAAAGTVDTAPAAPEGPQPADAPALLPQGDSE